MFEGKLLATLYALPTIHTHFPRLLNQPSTGVWRKKTKTYFTGNLFFILVIVNLTIIKFKRCVTIQ